MASFETPTPAESEEGEGDSIIGYLDLNNPEEKAYADELNESAAEHKRDILERYPTPGAATEPYRQGEIELYDLQVAFSPEEVNAILDECRKRNEEEKAVQ